jgi:hypothetical protein
MTDRMGTDLFSSRTSARHLDIRGIEMSPRQQRMGFPEDDALLIDLPKTSVNQADHQLTAGIDV